MQLARTAASESRPQDVLPWLFVQKLHSDRHRGESSERLPQGRARRRTSGIHCMQAACAHRPGSVVGLSAPPATGHRQHCGGGRPSSFSSQARHSHMSSTPAGGAKVAFESHSQKAEHVPLMMPWWMLAI